MYLNAISYAFSSTGTFNFLNFFLVPLLVPLGPLILVVLEHFYKMPLVMLLVLLLGPVVVLVHFFSLGLEVVIAQGSHILVALQF